MLERHPLPEHVSYSQMKSYAECPYRFTLERVWKVPEKPSVWLLGGSAFHDVVEHQELARLDLGEPITWTEAWDKQVAQAETKHPGVPLSEYRRAGRVSKANPNKEDVDFWQKLGPQMVSSYGHWRRIVPWIVATLDDRPAIEWEINVDLDGVPLVGAADILFEDPREGTLIAVDLKTGATKKETPDQLGTYAACVRLVTGREVKWGTFYRAREGQHDGLRWMEMYHPDRLKFEYGQFQTLRDSGFAMPNRAEHCNWCSVRDYCIYQGGSKASQVSVPWGVYDEPMTSTEENK